MSADRPVLGSQLSSPPTGPDGVDVFELGAEHEQVVFCNDHVTGLKAIVAIHSTALGPGLGGTRFYPYPTTAEAIRDVLNLSRGMSYKAALAGLDLGGGKAVIIGDPMKDKTEALLRAYGRFVQAIGGRYYTACDVGTYSEDMDVVARECRFVTGRTVAHGGAGDSSVLTAYGVYQGMRASAEVLWGSPTLSGRTVGIAGVGKVGHHLVKHLVDDGAQVVVTDVYQPAVDRMVKEYGATAVADADALVRAEIDVYAPCAMGDALTDDVVDVLTAKIVCGAANNQLSHPGIEKALADRGILYAPDYCVNSGGLIQVADELDGFSFERAEQRASKIYDTTKAVFELARTDAVTPAEAADRLAERRMRDVGRLRGLYLPR
jgi:valine dehydrogenase (NAD+)